MKNQKIDQPDQKEQMAKILKRQSQVNVLKPARNPNLPVDFDFSNVFHILKTQTERNV